VLKLLSKIRKYRRQKAYLFPGYAFAFMDEGIAIAAICRPNDLSAIVWKNRANISEWEAYLDISGPL